MAKVVTLTNKNGDIKYPRTKASAVYADDNGTMLSSLLTSIQAAIASGGTSFTDAQKNAINSGITSALVGELARLGNLKISFSDDTLTIFDAGEGVEKSYPLGNPVTYTYGNPTLAFTYPTEVGVNGDAFGLSTFAVTQVATGGDSTTKTFSYSSLSAFLSAGGSIAFTLASDYDTFSINEANGVITVEPNSLPVDKEAVVTITVSLHGKNVSVDSSTITQDAAAAAGDDDVMISLGYFDGCDSSMGTLSGDGAVGIGVSTTVVATPEEGYEFVGWYSLRTGNLVSTESSYTFIPNANTTLYAKFALESEDVETEVTFSDLGAYTFTDSQRILISSDTYHVYYAYMPAGYGMYISCIGETVPDRNSTSATMMSIGRMDSVPAEGKEVSSYLLGTWRFKSVRYFVSPRDYGHWVLIRIVPNGTFAGFTGTLMKVTDVEDVSSEVAEVAHDSGEGVGIDGETIYTSTNTDLKTKYVYVEADSVLDVALTTTLAAYSSSRNDINKRLRFGSTVSKDSDNNGILDIPVVGDSLDEYYSYPVYRSTSNTNDVNYHFAFPPKDYARYVLINGDMVLESGTYADGFTGITAKKYAIG